MRGLAGNLRVLIIGLSVLLALAAPARGGEDQVRVESNASFWWIIDEEVENGLFQNGSLDQAADRASGFILSSGRIALAWQSASGRIEALVSLRLEQRTDVLDFYGTWNFRPWLKVSVGQMRIPSTREGLTPYYDLDFISKSTFGTYISDYSLSRTPYISSVMAVKSYDRDMGLALRGDLKNGDRSVLSWFMMLSNGIGAGKYVGGREEPGFIYTNRAGDHYYGARVEVSPRSGVTFGFHLSRNIHEDVTLGERGPVLDFDRSARTADIQTRLPWGQCIYAFYGEGKMDDFSLAQRYVFKYEGWGLSLVQPFFGERFEVCARFDNFETRYTTGSVTTDQDNFTVGVNFRPDPRLRLMLNYLIKDTKNASKPDLDDNILYLDLQFTFDTGLNG
ncbi:MAG: hypothetical protein KAV42_05720 [Candidatus Krumholzibacteria bacterium]|nr:hypothetical protein [Candidatus Krumholzibacteria bacterium]